MSTTKPKRKLPIRLEIIVMLVIFVCVSHQIYFMNEKNMKGNLLMLNDIDFIVSGDEKTEAQFDQIARMRYDPDAMCFIEVKDAELNTIFKTSFISENFDYSVICQDQELQKAYMSKEKGILKISVDNDVCEVKFKWVDLPDKHLIIYATSDLIKCRLLVSRIMCYIAVALTVLMIFLNLYWQLRGVSNRYNEVNQAISDKLRQ